MGNKALFGAASGWWYSKRPVGWSLAQHLANATINTTTPSEKWLAREVVKLVKKQKRKAPPNG